MTTIGPGMRPDVADPPTNPLPPLCLLSGSGFWSFCRRQRRQVWVKKDGWRCSRIASCALDSCRSERGRGGAPAPRSHDLLPSIILNTVMDEQRPRLEVQQRPGHPPLRDGIRVGRRRALSEKRRSCFAWASRMQSSRGPLRLGRQAFFGQPADRWGSQPSCKVADIAQSLCRGNVAQRVCWPPVPRPHTQAPSDDHGAEKH